MTRQEHVDWCKKRALVYIENGEMNDAWASMISDLRKHEETKEHMGIELGMRLILNGHLSNIFEMEKFILGFH